ncbi:hypothetical protein [Hymenobacter lapidiphilus]|uniref:Uncharacterized protein n=1 Tax=Hymenobacter lapidiphilus TaxID=2608003 RepID=A0A7Y7PMU2_9BACT|nr:hypothetical protein [Hymenobacter lapidiphilus]NVO30708.1 hypothetical protein [Hymenobacter lapidiphilus]
MSFFSLTISASTSSAIRQVLASTTSLPTLDVGALPPLPPGAQRRHREGRAQAHCRMHARSAPHSSAKRW